MVYHCDAVCTLHIGRWDKGFPQQAARSGMRRPARYIITDGQQGDHKNRTQNDENFLAARQPISLCLSFSKF